MMLSAKKMGLITGLTLMIISIAGKSMAFPLPTADIKRIASSVQVAMNQALQIKQEIESNLLIVKEIQNGGYAAAAGDLFAKVQNGDYDRFGNNLKGLQESTYAATHSAKSVQERQERQRAERAKKEEEKLKANAEANKKGAEQAKETHKKANQSFFGRAYNWIKGNRATTTSGLNAIDAIKDGDTSRWLDQGAKSVGGIVGGTDGAEIGAVGGIASAGTDIVNNTKGDDFGEVLSSAVKNTANNGKLSGSVDSLNKAGAEQQAQQEAAKQKAAEEQKKQNEELAQKLKEQMAEETKKMKQQQCQACRAQNPNSGCISACSF
ncbi:MAG: hypothetical protein IJ218_06840 [Alphaproteobacteria bacterium]|nr:hypothetical protein [Alphaproteobacteria bacterium]